MKRVIAFLFFIQTYIIAQNCWQPLNSLHYSGRVWDIYQSPNGVLYASTDYGIFRSTNDGETWGKFAMENLTVYSFYESNAGNIFASRSDGLYRSSDNGLTWEKTGPMGYRVQAFLTGPKGEIYAGSIGLYRSNDDGHIWELVGFDSVEIVAILKVNDSSFYVSATNRGIFFTTNSGSTWETRSLGLPALGYRRLIKDRNNNLFAGSDGNGVYKSTDGGNSWSFSGLNTKNIPSLIVDSNDVLFAGTNKSGIYKSSDRGVTWRYFGLMNQSFDFTICMISLANGNLLLGTDLGIYMYSKQLSGWKVSGLTDRIVMCLETDKAQNLFAGTYFGLYRSTDRGGQWLGCGPFINRIITVKEVIPGCLLVFDQDSGMYRSTNHGEKWERIEYSFNTYYLLVAGRKNGDIFAVTYSGIVYTSKDTGRHWQEISPLGISNVNSVVSNSKGYLFVSTGVGVYRSMDSGLNWVKMVDNPSGGMIFINSNDVIFCIAGNGILISSDDGATWSSRNVSDNRGTALTADADNHVFFITSSNVYRTLDGGMGWDDFSSGTEDKYLVSICSCSDGYVYLGTTNGVYRTSNTTLFKNNESCRYNDFDLSPNYPNPFNPSTRIEYSLNQLVHVNITVYDLLGNKVAVLVNEEKQPGNYSVNFSGKGLASGVYFYRLQTGNRSVTRKMILLY